MQARLLQDYVTVRGTPSTTVVQPSYGWLDLGSLEDVAMFLDVRETMGSAKITYQTAAAADASAFLALTGALTLAIGTVTTNVQAPLANVPALRFLRWTATGNGSPWDATFRIWVVGYGWA
jgi:hypothetical protein